MINELSRAEILIVGAGYVGTAYACFLAQKNQVEILDIDEYKVNQINNGTIPFAEKELLQKFDSVKNNIKASTSIKSFPHKIIFLCLPTNYDDKQHEFNTELIESMTLQITQSNPNALIILKSTVPVGFTKRLKQKLKKENILFSPEFLREGSSMEDILNPERVIAGCSDLEMANNYLSLIKECVPKENFSKTKFKIMSEEDAEAVKLFSNTYLALRVAFFNELDTFCMEKKLNTKQIIEGICSDERIGYGYNNPSFGYGGYCLPKDSKQLLTNYDKVPQDIISSVVTANETRKRFIANQILNMDKTNIGIYRLTMKSGSDNYRESSILSIIELIKTKKDIVIYEPLIDGDNFNNIKVTNNLDEFISRSEIIIANRLDENLIKVREKVFTRDLYGKN